MTRRNKQNLNVSQWFRQSIVPMAGLDAHCKAHQELPWTGDYLPGFDDAEAMRQVCSDCPVINACAAYGLTAAGGFYAGEWVPWKDNADSSDNVSRLRSRARNNLRRIAARLPAMA